MMKTMRKSFIKYECYSGRKGMQKGPGNLKEQSEDLKNSSSAYQEHQRKDPALGDWKPNGLCFCSGLSLLFGVNAGKLGVSGFLPWGLMSLGIC